MSPNPEQCLLRAQSHTVLILGQNTIPSSDGFGNNSTKLSAAATIQIRIACSPYSTPTRRQISTKISSLTDTLIWVCSVGTRDVQPRHCTQERCLPFIIFHIATGSVKSWLFKGTPKAASLKMCQQYLLVYPEVVKKPEVFKTVTIFCWCYVLQLRAISAEKLKGFWKSESYTTENGA